MKNRALYLGLFGITFAVWSFRVFAEECTTNVLWSEDIEVNGSSPDRATALEGCAANLEETVADLKDRCDQGSGTLIFNGNPQCVPERCYYYGPPVRSYFCFHKNQAKCCETTGLR